MQYNVGAYVEHKCTRRRGVIKYISGGGYMMVILFDEWQVIPQKGYEGWRDGREEGRAVASFRKVVDESEYVHWW